MQYEPVELEVRRQLVPLVQGGRGPGLLGLHSVHVISDSPRRDHDKETTECPHSSLREGCFLSEKSGP